MAWDIENDEHRQAIHDAGAPPADLSGIVQSDFWRWVFTIWPGAQDGLNWQRFHLFADLRDGMSIAGAYDKYSGDWDPRLPVDLSQLAQDVSVGRVEESEASIELRNSLVDELDAVRADFLDDVRGLQGAALVGEPEALPGVSAAELEANHATLDGWLKWTLDNLEVDDEAPFYQVGNSVLTSSSIPPRWLEALPNVPGFCAGVLRRKTSKGRATIKVTGSNDEAGFKEAFRRVSDKKLQFAGSEDEED
jgi:hypothetical protein